MRRLTWLLLIAGLALVPMQSRAADESLRVLPLRTRPVCGFAALRVSLGGATPQE